MYLWKLIMSIFSTSIDSSGSIDSVCPSPRSPILELNDLRLFEPEEPTAPADKQVEESGTGEQRRIASLWNNYGGAIATEAEISAIDPAVALAIFAVESGRAYDVDTKLVIARFEPHVFKRFTGKAVAASHSSQKAEWTSIAEAYAIDPDAALRSASYGLPQLMGFNHGVTPYASAKDLLLAFQRSCREQIAGFFGFVRKNGLEDKARKEDFVGFARKYNGVGKEDLYAKKMKNYLEIARRLLEE
jgi:hypothetical protein